MPFSLDISNRKTQEEKLSFSDRQRLRKTKALEVSGDGKEETFGSLPLFRRHKVTKPDKESFSERQKQRKAGDLAEEVEAAKPIFRGRIKSSVTFSERQRQRKKKTKERDALDCIDGVFEVPWSLDDVSPSGSPQEGGLKWEEGAVLEEGEVQEPLVENVDVFERKKPGFRIKLGGTARRLVSGAIAGGVSRTVVAPLETIRTHLMVGNTGKKSVSDVFQWIMEKEGWPGLFRGNAINVLRVAPSKAIELYTYETVKKALTPKDGSPPRFPIASVAGSSAGIASCVLTYPLELVKTRLTVQPDAYRGVLHAFWKIITQEGIQELYRGLIPSVIGVIPYAGTNYYAYDALRTLYKKVTKAEKIGSLPTLCIGSTAGAFAATCTFPLEVARKQMQVGALSGRVVYKGTLDCLATILREQGPGGLYRGLGPSCIKLMPAAGISFMCYEALKQILTDEDKP